MVSRPSVCEIKWRPWHLKTKTKSSSVAWDVYHCLGIPVSTCFTVGLQLNVKLYSVWKSLLGLALAYLRDLCCTTMRMPGLHSLHSNEQGFLIIPFAHTTTKQNHAFSVVDPLLWNGLSLTLLLFPRIVSFYTHVKPFLFGLTGIGSAPE